MSNVAEDLFKATSSLNLKVLSNKEKSQKLLNQLKEIKVNKNQLIQINHLNTIDVASDKSDNRYKMKNIELEIINERQRDKILELEEEVVQQEEVIKELELNIEKIMNFFRTHSVSKRNNEALIQQNVKLRSIIDNLMPAVYEALDINEDFELESQLTELENENQILKEALNLNEFQ